MNVVLAQIPGADQAITSATREGWVAVLLVVMVLAMSGCFGWIIRRIMADATQREDRLSARVTHLEDVIRGELFQVLRANSEAMGKMLAASESVVRAADRMTDALERFTHILQAQPCPLAGKHVDHD